VASTLETEGGSGVAVQYSVTVIVTVFFGVGVGGQIYVRMVAVPFIVARSVHILGIQISSHGPAVLQLA
jgi:hypothetical protein